jgi:hypothetical protein
METSFQQRAVFPLFLKPETANKNGIISLLHISSLKLLALEMHLPLFSICIKHKDKKRYHQGTQENTYEPPCGKAAEDTYKDNEDMDLAPL